MVKATSPRKARQRQKTQRFDALAALVTAGKLSPVCKRVCHSDTEADALAERYGKAA